LRLTSEGNNANKYTGLTVQLTFMLITPIALAIAYFSMDQKVIPYEMSFKSFLITTAFCFIFVQAIVRICDYVLKQPGSIQAVRIKLRAQDYGDRDYSSQESSNPDMAHATGVWWHVFQRARRRSKRETDELELSQV
jgi:hypothetical protein